MSALNQLEFVKKAPRPTRERAGLSPLERGRRKLVQDIRTQIELARNPDYEIVKQSKKRGTGELTETRRKPKSWAVVTDGVAYVTVRFSNKPMPIGGKRGSIIKCDPSAIEQTLTTVRDWAQSPEADDAIEKMMKASKRKK